MLVCVGLLALVLARKVVGLRRTATVLAAGYLVYRAAMGLGLAALGFPPSVLSLVLLAGAVVIDVAVVRGVRGRVAGPVVAAAVYAAASVRESFEYLPWNWASVVPVAAGLGLLWAAVDSLARSAWPARWQEADEPVWTTRIARGPGRPSPAR